MLELPLAGTVIICDLAANNPTLWTIWLVLWIVVGVVWLIKAFR